MSRGKLIALEGIDASGKATQSKILAFARSAQLFSFPRYTTDVGVLIAHNLRGVWSMPGPDANAIVLQSLMAIDRYAAAADIEVYLNAGVDVVLDRYWASGYVHGGADGLSLWWLDRIHKFLPQPDCWVLLDVEPEESVRRRPERRDRFERDAGKMLHVREGYLQLFCERERRREPWRVIDGSGSVAEVTAAIARTVNELCGTHRSPRAGGGGDE